MTLRVKICGLKTEATVNAALEAGADYVGLVFHEASPRNVDLATAGRLAALARGRAQVVALLVDPDNPRVAEVVSAVGPDIIQLHGSESPERVAEIARISMRPVMKAVKVETPADAEGAFDYQGAAELILFDAKAPEHAEGMLPGGNGVAFDWRALRPVWGRIPFMLAGGLNPENVAEAVRLTGAAAVDVSSGVETRPGEKDAELIRRFLHAAKTAMDMPSSR